MKTGRVQGNAVLPAMFPFSEKTMKTTVLGKKRAARVEILASACRWRPGNRMTTRSFIATIQAVLDAGINFLDVADFYGMGRAEHLIGQAAQGPARAGVPRSVKCGAMFAPSGAFRCGRQTEGGEEFLPRIRSGAWEWDAIDLYQPCRVDPEVPYEETISAVADLIKEGKVSLSRRVRGGGEARAHRPRHPPRRPGDRVFAGPPVRAVKRKSCRRRGNSASPSSPSRSRGRPLAGMVAGEARNGNPHYIVPRMQGTLGII